ncbi:unnamed protein product [Camellia sinensis]
MPNMAKMTPGSEELIKSDRIMFKGTEDTMLMKQIQATHAPDGHEINVRFIFQIVEDILTRSGMHAPSSVTILFKCIEGKDDHQVEALMFNMLSSYSWDAKLVLTLSAFALYNGQLWLLV